MISIAESIAVRLVWIPAAVIAALCSGVLSGCSRPQAAAKEAQTVPPAVVRNAPAETDLATITLTEAAEQRLGLSLAPASYQRITLTRTYGAEVVLPPDRSTVVTCPMAGILQDGARSPAAGMPVRKGQSLYRLQPYVAPERDLRLQLERDVAAAETRAASARVRLERAEQLVRDKAGSEKSAQQMREEYELAANDLARARGRLQQILNSPFLADASVSIVVPRDGNIRNVFASPGQAVPVGTPLFEVADYSAVWIRVPVYVGELKSIDLGHFALIRGLTDSVAAAARRAAPVAAPPAADAQASTVDLFYEIRNDARNGAGFLRPGERINATLALRDTGESLVVPWSAVLRDAAGGSWVYENIAPHVYTRRRIEILHVLNSLAVLNRGPAAGSMIVSAGALELFGTEFGTGK
jgi:cobalt-zinc-cadmium efflux system membrane fusion protein